LYPFLSQTAVDVVAEDVHDLALDLCWLPSPSDHELTGSSCQISSF
jgi:hypothetical protein